MSPSLLQAATAGFITYFMIYFLHYIFMKRKKEQKETAEQICQTHFYCLLEDIKNLHPGKRNLEQITNLSDQILDFNNTFRCDESIKTKVERLYKDLNRKEEELTTEKEVSMKT